MLARVERRRSDFAARGYGEGHRVGLLFQNRPVFVEMWFALNALGVSVVPINPDLRQSELEYIIAHSEMNVAFVLAERRSEIEAAAREAGRAIPVATGNDQVPAPFGGARASVAGDASTECALLYTSGTTGQPKGCVLTNRYFLHSGDWYRDVGGLIDLKDDEERMITPLPLFHMNAMAVSLMAMLSVGGSLTQSIFKGGSLKGQYDYSKARYDELLANYHKAVISAFSDVENALTAVQQTSDQLQREQEAVNQAQRAYDYAQSQFRGGIINIITLLNTQTSLFSAEDTLMQVKFSHLQALVSLFNALGCGWQQSTVNVS